MVGYRADIDGLRGLAVLAVVIFHSDLGLNGGFVGVDVFFVISGYLITSLIQNEINLGKFSYLKFWERRCRRLAPALFACVGFTLLSAYFLLLPNEFKELGQSAIAQSLGLANIYFWRESGYFDGSSEIKPLLHMWSLAVEEQFYLFMPALLIFLNRFRRHFILPSLSIVALISLIWCIFISNRHPESAFYLLPSRAWELLLGGITFFLTLKWTPRKKSAETMSLVGLCFIAISFFNFNQSTPFPSWYAMIPCFGSILLIWSNCSKHCKIGSLLKFRLIVSIGKISYSLYLFHWPLMAYQNYLTEAGFEGFSATTLLFASFLLATISYHFIEQPFRKRNLLNSSKSIFVGTGIGVVSCLLIGYLMHHYNGFRGRYSSDTLIMADGRSDHNKDRKLTHDISIEQLSSKGLPRIDDNLETSPILALIGDSHCDAVMPILIDLCKKNQIPTVAATASATIPLITANNSSTPKDNYRRALFTALEQLEDLKNVLIIARWTKYPNLMTHENLEKTVKFFTLRDCRVWFLRQVPEPSCNVPLHLAFASHWYSPVQYGVVSRSDFLNMRKETDSIFKIVNNPMVRTLDPISFFFPDNRKLLLQRNFKPLYFDDDHLSVTGALEIVTLFEQVTNACLNEMEKPIPMKE